MFEIYFAQIREDSLVERDVVLKVKPRKLLCVGSGGCTAFSLLNDTIEDIYCIDSNIGQCALIELKKAAIQNLNREEYLQFIGEQFCNNRKEIFNHITKTSSLKFSEYWKMHPEYIEMGINKCGVTEKFYRYISECILQFIKEGEIWEKLFECKSLEEQEEYYKKYFNSESWITGIRILLSKSTHLLFFPSFMFARSQINDFSNFFLKQFEKELKFRLVSNNYFLSQFIFSQYLMDKKEGMPFYLSADGYELTKGNIHKLSIYHSDVKTACTNIKNIDCFILSNIFDWADEKEREKICTSINSSHSISKSILYRNMFASVDLSKYLSKGFRENKEHSESLYFKERSMMYNKISLLQL